MAVNSGTCPAATCVLPLWKSSGTLSVTTVRAPNSSTPRSPACSCSASSCLSRLGTGLGNTLILDRVSKAAKVQKGDIIVTQGTVDPRYPDLYPYGIQIGSVLSASTSDIASYYTVQVTPFARLDSLDAVAALISTKHR